MRAKLLIHNAELQLEFLRRLNEEAKVAPHSEQAVKEIAYEEKDLLENLAMLRKLIAN